MDRKGQDFPLKSKKKSNKPYPHRRTPHIYPHLIFNNNIVNSQKKLSTSATTKKTKTKKLCGIFLCDIEVLLRFRWSAVKVPLKCHWSAIEVPTANSQQPTVTATGLPLLTLPLFTVGWSKTVSFSNLEKNGPPAPNKKSHFVLENYVITGQFF